MYILTINYTNGETVCTSSDDFARIQEAVDSIDRSVETILISREDEPVEKFNGDETSHLSGGI